MAGPAWPLEGRSAPKRDPSLGLGWTPRSRAARMALGRPAAVPGAEYQNLAGRRNRPLARFPRPPAQKASGRPSPRGDGGPGRDSSRVPGLPPTLPSPSAEPRSDGGFIRLRRPKAPQLLPARRGSVCWDRACPGSFGADTRALGLIGSLDALLGGCVQRGPLSSCPSHGDPLLAPPPLCILPPESCQAREPRAASHPGQLGGNGQERRRWWQRGPELRPRLSAALSSD